MSPSAKSTAAKRASSRPRARTSRVTLFEISWEVAHRVGGIHTVVSTKARLLAERYRGRGRDDYVVIGPWLLEQHDPDAVLDAAPEHAAFEESVRRLGLAVRVGRWRVPGRPLAILVDFSSLYDRKDEILAGLWETHEVDSLFGGWSYVEPVLFGHAAGMVAEHCWRHVSGRSSHRAIVHAHEWMTGSALMYLTQHAPEIATVFTTHATVIGRAAAERGRIGDAVLDGKTPGEVAAELGVRARHSLEAASARVADVFTTVSSIAAEEAAVYLGRTPEPVLPNGLDPDVLAERIGGVARETAAAGLRDLASRFLGEDVGDAALVCMSGRYEFRNKGIDLTLAAAAELNGRPGRPIVLFLLIPAGSSGLRMEVTERLASPEPLRDGPVGVTLHHLHDPAADAVLARCTELGLDNAKGSRVKVVFWADYLRPGDGILGMRYEAVLQGADLTCFPSNYEAWGYTPQESVALGVPTVTTDLAGFGCWVRERGLDDGECVTVLAREGRDDADVASDLAATVERLTGNGTDEAARVERCRAVTAATEWATLISAYETAHKAALAAATDRAAVAPARPLRVSAPVGETKRRDRPNVFPLDVENALPKKLAGLERLASNWWWSSDPEATSLFESVDSALWDRVHHAPIRLLRETPRARLAELAGDSSYCKRLASTVKRFERYVSADLDERGLTRERPVAYVCAEFGLHESFPIYSGGLGVLAGDHLRAASDLRVPLVAVGLLYRAGYMRQRLRGGVRQETEAEVVNPSDLPLTAVTGPDGAPVEVTLDLPGCRLALRAWRTDVGRVPLYLLDADVPSNAPEDREITRALYSGDQSMRIRQEIVLGIGSMRLLHAIGVRPAVVHVNEGHGAFTAIERVHTLLRETGLTFDAAHEVVRASTVFTTHTPVPAGHDEFPEDLVRRYFGHAERWSGVPWERFMALGESAENRGHFNMTGLAVRFAARVNGVSKKHADVSRGLLHRFAPQLLPGEVPVRPVTNGVHLGLWTSAAARDALGADRVDALGDAFRGAGDLGDAELWKMRTALRTRLREELVAHLRRSFAAQGDSPALLAGIEERLRPDALYIGFARRFATYKRAGLIFRDVERLLDLLEDADCPVRLVIAGKAHPRDEQGQEVLARIGTLARDPRMLGRVILLENYDIGVSRWLVSGVDVWLNTPRPPMEASGTSGMKAAANGVLNLSIGDGWWLEGADGRNGWTIGAEGGGTRAAQHHGDEHRDASDAVSLMSLLQHEVVPEFFERDKAGRPKKWLERVRGALVSLPPTFDAGRMVAEYREWAYEPLAAAHVRLSQDGFGVARDEFRDLERVRRALGSVRVVSATIAGNGNGNGNGNGGQDGARTIAAGEPFEVEAQVDLAGLDQAEVAVEALIGRRTGEGGLTDVTVVTLDRVANDERERAHYRGTVDPPAAGALGWAVRVRPARDPGPAFDDPVVWA